MAAAEVRAVWQRTANRCFVQEDAKRAPKLACCQSPSTPKQFDAGAAAPADVPDHPSIGFMPLNRNPSCSNLPPDTRWWLQMQPNYGYHKGFTYEQGNSLEGEEETLKAGVVNSTTRISEAHKWKGDAELDGQTNRNCFVDAHNNGATKTASETGKQNVKTVEYMDMKELFELDDSTESWEIMQMDYTDYPDTKQPNEKCFDPEYSWMGSEKIEPWWRMIDKDELVSLVARKSLDHIENCDLPPPQKMCQRSHLFASHVGCFDNKESSPSLDGKTQTLGLSSGVVCAQRLANPGRTQEKYGYLSEGHLHVGSDGKSR